MEQFKVGQRVVSRAGTENRESNADNAQETASNKGTVRFVGEVRGTKGTWVGVEWDEDDRGKHDGTNDGHSYFKVRPDAPKSGSFVREHKIRGGGSLMDGVRERYGQPADALIDKKVLKEVQKAMNAPLLQLVGFEDVAKRQSEFHKLRIISVRGHLVSVLGENDEDRNIGEVLAHVQSLDLSEALVSSWDDVTDIVSRLNHLISLDVSGNRMQMPVGGGVGLNNAFDKLTQLKMGYQDIRDWNKVLAIASGLPNLEYLSVVANGFAEIGPLPEGTFQKLESIDLSANPIGDWANVLRFSKLPKLVGINVASCNISCVSFPDDGEETLFPALYTLNLSHNLLKDWDSIGRLNRLRITDLRLRSNPVMETLEGGRCRQLLVASIATLIVCNGTTVDRVERRGAEIDYWKLYGQKYLGLKDQEEKDAFAARHPRYSEFVIKYGDPDDIDVNKVEDVTIKGNLISVKIECPSKPGFKTVVKRLPPTMQVRKLRPLLQRVVGQRGHDLQLSYICMVYPDLVQQMNDELKEIDYYSLKNDDVIIVNF
jgi:hypothetical protein